jgi:hypothetical protein
MPRAFYTALGYVIWRALIRGAREEIKRNRVKLGAAAIVAAVIFGGIAAARSNPE